MEKRKLYNLKIIKSGDRIEIYKINNYVIGPKKNQDEDIEYESKKSKGSTKEKDRNRNLRDSRNNIIRLIKSNSDMKTFITLTFSDERDYKNSKKCLKSCFDKLRKDYKDLKYLWVLEYGDKNARLHFHVLCNISINIKLASTSERKSEEHKALENNFNKRYWNYGYVFIRSLSQEDNTNIALYVSVYITKSMENKELEGYRIYGYSHKTLNKPIEEKYYTTNNIDDILSQYKEYRIIYTNSYPIGYTDYRGEHEGNVSYFDLIKEK